MDNKYLLEKEFDAFTKLNKNAFDELLNLVQNIVDRQNKMEKVLIELGILKRTIVKPEAH